MTDELKVLSLVCQRLETANIPYMLTGSWAAHFYQVPRMTRDIDLVIEVLNPDADRLFQLFQDEFYVLSKETIKEVIERQGMFNIIHNETLFKVDFIIRKNSLYRKTEFARRQRLKLLTSEETVEVWVVSPEDLIVSKLFWAKDSLSSLQLRDVKSLISSIPKLDKNYIEEWVQKLQLNHVYEKVHG